MRATITSPTGDVYTNGELTIQVVAEGADELELLRDGQLLANIPPPYTYIWDTRQDVEATYEIAARARRGQGEWVVSNAVTVHVDRTPPFIQSLTPSRGETNWAIEDPLEVVFSEPINHTTVAGNRIQVIAGGAPLARSYELSAANDLLAIRLAATPPLPADVTVSLTTEITDRAGNSLLLPDEAWTFRLPAWHRLGGRLPNEEAALTGGVLIDSEGHPLVMARVANASPVETIVYRFTGTNWQQLGDALVLHHRARLRLLDGYPVIIDKKEDAEGGQWLERIRWDGDRWIDPDRFAEAGGTINGPVVAQTSDDTFLVAWNEERDGQSQGVILRCATAGCVNLGFSVDRTPRPSTEPFLAAGDDQKAFFGWHQSVESHANTRGMLLEGGVWTQLGDRINSKDSSHVRTAVTFMPNGGLKSLVMQKAPEREFLVSTWHWTPKHWSSSLGPNPDLNEDIWAMALMSDSKGRLIAYWAERTTIHVSRQENNVWVPMGPEITDGTASFGIAIDKQGTPYIPWQGASSARSEFNHKYVFRRNALPD